VHRECDFQSQSADDVPCRPQGGGELTSTVKINCDSAKDVSSYVFHCAKKVVFVPKSKKTRKTNHARNCIKKNFSKNRSFYAIWLKITETRYKEAFDAYSQFTKNYDETKPLRDSYRNLILCPFQNFEEYQQFMEDEYQKLGCPEEYSDVMEKVRRY
jgi:hypothetical protein